MSYDYSATRQAACIGRVEIEARFELQPVVPPEQPEAVTVYRADELTYDIRTPGCLDAPGDDLVYTFSEGLSLSGMMPLTEENSGFFPAYPQFSLQLPSDLYNRSELQGSYTTVDGAVFSAATNVVFEALSIDSNPIYCGANASDPARPYMLDFCTEPTPCANGASAPVDCYTDPRRYYVLPFERSFRWDAPGEPGRQYHIANLDVQARICEGCGAP